MPLFATAGSKIYIGNSMSAQSADFIASDFAAISWVEIAWAESIGEFGDESAAITFDAIGEGRTQKLKGTRNAGSMACRFGIDNTDPGQIALRAAEKTPDDYAIRVDFNDEPHGGTTPSKRYFIAKVMTAREVLDTANNVTRLNASLDINSNIVRVAAA